MNVTVHHEIPVESILLIVRAVGVYVFEVIAAVALCVLVIGVALRYFGAYLDRQTCRMDFNFDDEDDVRVVAGTDWPVHHFVRSNRPETMGNGTLPEKKQ